MSLDTRTPEEKVAGIAATLAWLDSLPEEWQRVLDNMRAKRREAVLPIERWEGEGGR